MRVDDREVAVADERRPPGEASNSTHARLYWSARPSAASPRICSGATYATVPTRPSASAGDPSELSRASPKSQT